MQLPLRDVNCYATWNERCVKQKRKTQQAKMKQWKKTFGVVLENQISFCILMSIVIVKVIAIVVADELLL